MATNIKYNTLFVASCHPCNSRNSRSYLCGILSSTPSTFSTHRMSLDIIGPRVPTHEGLSFMSWYSYRWILVMINNFTKRLVAVPLRDRKSPALIEAFTDHWLSESYACIEVFANRAPEMWGTEFRELLHKYGSKFIPGPLHHSQTQGFEERAKPDHSGFYCQKLERQCRQMVKVPQTSCSSVPAYSIRFNWTHSVLHDALLRTTHSNAKRSYSACLRGPPHQGLCLQSQVKYAGRLVFCRIGAI